MRSPVPGWSGHSSSPNVGAGPPSEPDRRCRRRRWRESSARGGTTQGRGACRGRRARSCWGEGARGDRLRHARALRAPRRDAALHRRAARGRRRAGRRGSAGPESEHGGGLERLREAGVDVESRRAARVPLPASRSRSGGPGRQAAAVRDVQGRGHARRRVPVPGRRWVTGEESRLVHVCARSRTPSRSAWAPCAGTTRGSMRATSPSSRQPRRIAFGRGPLPEGSELELHSATSVRSSRSCR